MAEIIQFGKKAQDLKSIRDMDLRQRKIDSLKKLFQCTRCVLKCAKCGAQLESNDEEGTKYASPYAFCRQCQEEYEEYRDRMKGKQQTPRYYWHNEVWMKIWETWLEQQKWMDHYRQSKEFLQLFQEVEELLRR